MRAVILVPRREGQDDRDKLWQWCKAWWAERFAMPIYEGHHGPEEGLFSRSAAINRAARLADEDGNRWDVAVIIDADVIIDPQKVMDGIRLAAVGDMMVLPFSVRKDLSKKGTERVMAGYPGSWERLVHKRYDDTVSSVVIVSRQLWDAVGGFDEYFRGWGFEDNAFAAACTTFGGPIRKLEGEVWHLWHATAKEGKRGTPTYTRNRARAQRFHDAMGDREATRRIQMERETDPVQITVAPGIPRILHRVVPEQTSDEVERWWAKWAELHPGWDLRTHRDPLDPAQFPLTSPSWHLAANGAQLADLIRLEVLYTEGGIYVDSDVEPYRPLDALLPLAAFAAWEDKDVVPNAVMGAVPRHPAIDLCLRLALARVNDPNRPNGPGGTWEAGPGVTTEILPWRPDVLLLPPGSFYPYHYTEAKKKRGWDHSDSQPWSFGAHHWHGSWLPEGKRW